MDKSCTGVILAGGQNSRFCGTNKALLHIGAKRILDYIHDIYKDLFQDIILVTNDPLQYLAWDVNIVTDLFPVRSSLSGIHAGLFYTTTPYSFIMACDTPFIRKELIETILDNIDSRIDVVIPETSEGLEPLCCVYSKHCIEPITRQLEKRKLKISHIFSKLRIKKLAEKMLRQKDPDLMSFYNINTPEDLAKAQKYCERLDEQLVS